MSILSGHFDKTYELELDASGNGIVNEEAFGERLNQIYALFEEKHSRAPRDVLLLILDSLQGGFTGIDGAFLERIPTLKELIIADSVTDIIMTEKLLDLLHGNYTLIRGSFDSVAERMAIRYNLPFRPKDYCFLYHTEECYHETTTLTLIFHRDGSITIEEDVSTPGSSAGNTFGGNFTKKLPAEFWKSLTAEQIAGMYSSYLTEAILKNGRLSEFIRKAQEKEIYIGEN